MRTLFSSDRFTWLSMTIAVAVGVFFVVGLVEAATTISTNIQTDGNLSVTGTASVTGLSTLTTASTTGAVSLAGALWIGGNATTTAAGDISTQASLTVGSAGTALTTMKAGYCTITSTTVTATSSAYARCTGATGVTSSDRVVSIVATSSMMYGLIIDSASSTATTGTIGVRIANPFGNAFGGNSTTTGVQSFNYWAVAP